MSPQFVKLSEKANKTTEKINLTRDYSAWLFPGVPTPNW